MISRRKCGLQQVDQAGLQETGQFSIRVEQVDVGEESDVQA